MSGSLQMKVLLVAVMGTAIVIVRRDDGFAAALLALGIFNVVVAPKGTGWVRLVAVLWSSIALVSADKDFTRGALIVAWLAWPPALLVAWKRPPAAHRSKRATARDIEIADDADTGERLAARERARFGTAAVIAAVGCGSLMYRVLVGHGLQQTAALFVGIPTVLAIGVVFFVSPRSAVGVACKAVTVGLLVSLLFLGEGIVCVVMSAPLFYAIAVLVGHSVNRLRDGPRDAASTTLSCVALLALVPMSLEGLTPGSSFNRDEWITETRVVDAPSEAVARAMFEPPRFDRVLPAYLRAGFPRPIATRIDRADGIARWVIRFRGGEMRLDGIEPRTGDLVLNLEEQRPGFVSWRAVSDDSHMTHYLSWQESHVHWEPAGAGTTRVTWSLRYRRGLDPVWYFGPWERYAVRLAAGYLIESVATP